jgi:hypothetical protein
MHTEKTATAIRLFEQTSKCEISRFVTSMLMQEDTIPMAWWIRGIPMTRVPGVLPTGDLGQGDANHLPTNKSASCSLRRWILMQDVRHHSVIRTLSVDVIRPLRGYPQIGLVCSI